MPSRCRICDGLSGSFFNAFIEFALSISQTHLFTIWPNSRSSSCFLEYLFTSILAGSPNYLSNCYILQWREYGSKSFKLELWSPTLIARSLYPLNLIIFCFFLLFLMFFSTFSDFALLSFRNRNIILWKYSDLSSNMGLLFRKV